jgi:hypothetical protein
MGIKGIKNSAFNIKELIIQIIVYKIITRK